MTNGSAGTGIKFKPIDEYLVKYQDPKQADTIMKVQQELDETKIILVDVLFPSIPLASPSQEDYHETDPMTFFLFASCLLSSFFFSELISYIAQNNRIRLGAW